jgi:hypothetical protein
MLDTYSELSAHMIQRLSREELYNPFWREPASALAPCLGISEAKLMKACTSVLIPLPGRVCCAKRRAGNAIALKIGRASVYSRKKFIRYLFALAVSVIFLVHFAFFPAAAETIAIPKGQKTLVAFWKCVGWGYCNIKLHIDILNADGSPGRARLISTWEPGRTRDLDVHEGSYDDSLDAYLFMAYWLYAVAETDGVKVVVGSDVAP